MPYSRYILASIAVFGPSLHAQNLVLNAAFDEDLDGWSSNNGEDIAPIWSAVDVDDSPDSGSASIANLSASANNGVSFAQCVPANSGQVYGYGGHVRIPSGAGQSLDNRAVMSLRWYSDPECTIAIGGSVTTGGSPQSFDTWVSQQNTGVVAKIGSHSVEVRLLVSKVDAGGEFFAQFDAIFFNSRSIFANDFE